MTKGTTNRILSYLILINARKENKDFFLKTITAADMTETITNNSKPTQYRITEWRSENWSILEAFANVR